MPGNKNIDKLSIEGQLLICPVCKMGVSDRTPLTSQYGGKTYYFCSTVCKNVFEKEPRKYMAGDVGKKE